MAPPAKTLLRTYGRIKLIHSQDSEEELSYSEIRFSFREENILEDESTIYLSEKNDAREAEALHKLLESIPSQDSQVSSSSSNAPKDEDGYLELKQIESINCVNSNDSTNLSIAGATVSERKLALLNDEIVAEILQESRPFNPGPPFSSNETNSETSSKTDSFNKNENVNVSATTSYLSSPGLAPESAPASKIPMTKEVYSHGKKIILKIDGPVDTRKGMKSEVLEINKISEDKLAERLAAAFKNELKTDKINNLEEEYFMFPVTCPCGIRCKLPYNPMPGPWTHKRFSEATGSFNECQPNKCYPFACMPDFGLTHGMKAYLRENCCQAGPPPPPPCKCRCRKKKCPKPPPKKPPPPPPPPPPPRCPPPRRAKCKKKCAPFGILAPCAMPPTFSCASLKGNPYVSTYSIYSSRAGITPLPPTIIGSGTSYGYYPDGVQDVGTAMSFHPMLSNNPSGYPPYFLGAGLGATPGSGPGSAPGSAPGSGPGFPGPGGCPQYGPPTQNDFGAKVWVARQRKRCKSPRNIEMRVFKRDCDSGECSNKDGAAGDDCDCCYPEKSSQDSTFN